MQDIFLTIPRSDLSFLQQLAMRMGWKIDAKLDELQVTESLRRFVGVVPDMEDKNWKQEKEEYLQEKYGL